MPAAKTFDSKIPEGSLVLVTGASGFIASHASKQLLERGYRVRGTARDLHSASWLISAFSKESQSGQFELAQVGHIGKEGAFDEAIKGVSGILHIATSSLSDTGGFEEDPEISIPNAVRDVTSIFKSALNEPSVKSFVLTGSIVGATLPIRGNDTKVGQDTYNEEAIKLANAPDQDPLLRGWFVYAASKTAAEKEFMKLLAEKKPHFSGNIVSPSGVVGEPLHMKHCDNHHNWVTVLYKGLRERFDSIPSSKFTVNHSNHTLNADTCLAFFVDVKDVALVHIAALLDSDVNSQRIQTWGRALSWNSVLKVLRDVRPQKEWLADLENPDRLTVTADQTTSETLLKKFGNGDWAPLEQTLTENLNNPFFKCSVGP